MRFKESVVADHEKECKPHLRSKRKRTQSIQPKKVTIEVLSDIPIKLGLNRMMSTEK